MFYSEMSITIIVTLKVWLFIVTLSSTMEICFVSKVDAVPTPVPTSGLKTGLGGGDSGKFPLIVSLDSWFGCVYVAIVGNDLTTGMEFLIAHTYADFLVLGRI